MKIHITAHVIGFLKHRGHPKNPREPKQTVGNLRELEGTLGKQSEPPGGCHPCPPITAGDGWVAWAFAVY